VLQRLEKMNFTVKPLQIFRALQKIIQFDLVPSNLNPLILIKCPISESIENRNKSTNIKCPVQQSYRKTKRIGPNQTITIKIENLRKIRSGR